MIVFPIYVYNTTTNSLVFNDLGLEIPGQDFYEFFSKNHLENFYYSGSSFYTAVQNGQLIFTRSNTNNPPLNNDIIPLSFLDSNQYIGEIDGGDFDSIYLQEQFIDCGGV